MTAVVIEQSLPVPTCIHGRMTKAQLEKENGLLRIAMTTAVKFWSIEKTRAILNKALVEADLRQTTKKGRAA